MLKLVKPDKSMEQEYLDYINEWKEEGINIVPASTDIKDRTFDEWLEAIQDEEIKERCPIGLVTANTYFLVNETGKILGAINIRHELNNYLYQYGGHIGYGVRESERRKGYATQMLKLSKPILKELDLEFVLITCSKTNVASSQTIKNNGGVLEDEVEKDGDITQRYWIDLNHVDSFNPPDKKSYRMDSMMNQTFVIPVSNKLTNPVENNESNRSTNALTSDFKHEEDRNQVVKQDNGFNGNNNIKLSWW